MHPTLNKSDTSGKHRPPNKLHTVLCTRFECSWASGGQESLCTLGKNLHEILPGSTNICRLNQPTGFKNTRSCGVSLHTLGYMIKLHHGNVTDWLTEWVLSWKVMILEGWSWAGAAGPKGEQSSHFWPLCCLCTIEQHIAWVPSGIPPNKQYNPLKQCHLSAVSTPQPRAISPSCTDGLRVRQLNPPNGSRTRRGNSI